MKTVLTVISWFAIVLGVLAILGSIAEPTDAAYSIIGGLLYITLGVLALVYVKSKEQ